MWRHSGLRPGSVPQDNSERGFRFRGPYRVLIILAVLFATFVFIVPVVFKPGVLPPAESPFGSPFSVQVQISNQDLTPLENVEYSCEISKLTLTNGNPVSGANVLTRGTIRSIAGRHAVTATCETAFIVNAPVKAAEYTLTLSYRNYPWPQQRMSVYHIAAKINGNGQVTGWKLVSN